MAHKQWCATVTRNNALLDYQAFRLYEYQTAVRLSACYLAYMDLLMVKDREGK